VTKVPKGERPDTSPSYGLAKKGTGRLPWSWVTERLAMARNYWVVTASRDGRPHAMPVWGVWFEETLYFSTSRHSRKGRNLAANRRVVVHLDSGDEAVILEGEVEDVRNTALIARASPVYEAKYADPTTGKGFPLPADVSGENAVFALRLERAFGWRESDYPKSATRWRFGNQG
jgi:hypothetical protein